MLTPSGRNRELRITILLSLFVLLSSCGESATETADNLKGSINDMTEVAKRAADIAEQIFTRLGW